ncbi:CgeB family protein [Burkholderia multivorans]|uniref:CgeB family protein n=1 Tax=Burkholderia multivorans TaxID=87883 RepID=UPI001C217B84|nr:glycosyltransferase [Burkholderia multivorans]MBU9332415.1 glycosyltransferase [Burkholderia multivorans]MBU9411743.1 glycosyltransferase [Burkholderia multivorans]UXZ83201.1 glycosyltransferase [Burkholderia multivorans]
MNILISGASPDSINNNATLRGYVANGFKDLPCVTGIQACSLESAATLARATRPDLIIVFGSCMPSVCHYLDLKQIALDTGACLAFWLHDDPYEFDYSQKIVPLADIVFSNDRWSSMHYDHPNVHHLPLAADLDAHFRAPEKTKSRDVFFCGVGFANRIQLLRDCASSLSGFKVEVLGAEWPDDLPFAANRRVPNADLPTLHATSLVTLNMGRRFDLANERFKLDASTPGPRTFEAAAAGTVQCMFVEGFEIDDYYSEQNGEILLFDSPAELRQHVEMLRDDRERATTIALAAQQRTRQEHTYRHRAETILRHAALTATRVGDSIS